MTAFNPERHYHGAPCREGHTLRYLKGDSCVPCAIKHQQRRRATPEGRAKKREAGRKFRAENLESERQRSRDYVRSHHLKMNRAAKGWRERQPYLDLIAHQLFHAARERARAKKKPFTITQTELRQLIGATSCCPIFGTPFPTSKQEVREHGRMRSYSLDALVPALGYTLQNVRIISCRANIIKSMGSAEEHRLIADWMLRETTRGGAE